MTSVRGDGRLGATRSAPAALPMISGHQDTLDGVRAIAALSVLVFHVASTSGDLTTPGTNGWLYNGGQIGVPVFFTLSGLLLYRPWAAVVLDRRGPPRTRTYLRKRALRILPAYWAVVICFMLTAGWSHLADPGTWLSLITLTHVYIPDPWWGSNLGPPHLGQIWSLCVEAAWYLTLPATAAVLSWYAKRGTAEGEVGRRARRLLTAIAAYGTISFGHTVVMFVAGESSLLGLWLPRFFVWFGIGMALAVLTVWARLEPAGPVARLCRTVAASWGACWTAALLLYVIGSTPVTGPLDLVSHDMVWTSILDLLVNGLCAAALVTPVALAPPGHPALGPVLGNRVMRFLGRISYSVFLWQMLIVVGWYRWADREFRGNVATDLPLMLAATIAVATAGYYLVERPAQRLARPGRRPPAPARPRDQARPPKPPRDPNPPRGPAPVQAREPGREPEREPGLEPALEAAATDPAEPAPASRAAREPAEPQAPPAEPSSARSTLPDLPDHPGGPATAPPPAGS